MPSRLPNVGVGTVHIQPNAVLNMIPGPAASVHLPTGEKMHFQIPLTSTESETLAMGPPNLF